MQRIVTYLWFDGKAEEAATLYTSLLPNSRITSVQRYPDAMPGVGGTVMMVNFVLEGQEFMALNGGPMYSFTPAISLFVKCPDQAEVDRLWVALTADGGSEDMCGWLKDRFGLSWQIIPDRLGEFLGDPDPARAGRAVQAMLGMHKIDIAALERARDGT